MKYFSIMFAVLMVLMSVSFSHAWDQSNKVRSIANNTAACIADWFSDPNHTELPKSYDELWKSCGENPTADLKVNLNIQHKRKDGVEHIEIWVYHPNTRDGFQYIVCFTGQHESGWTQQSPWLTHITKDEMTDEDIALIFTKKRPKNDIRNGYDDSFTDKMSIKSKPKNEIIIQFNRLMNPMPIKILSEDRFLFVRVGENKARKIKAFFNAAKNQYEFFDQTLIDELLKADDHKELLKVRGIDEDGDQIDISFDLRNFSKVKHVIQPKEKK